MAKSKSPLRKAEDPLQKTIPTFANQVRKSKVALWETLEKTIKASSQTAGLPSTKEKGQKKEVEKTKTKKTATKEEAETPKEETKATKKEEEEKKAKEKTATTKEAPSLCDAFPLSASVEEGVSH